MCVFILSIRIVDARIPWSSCYQLQNAVLTPGPSKNCTLVSGHGSTAALKNCQFASISFPPAPLTSTSHNFRNPPGEWALLDAAEHYRILRSMTRSKHHTLLRGMRQRCIAMALSLLVGLPVGGFRMEVGLRQHRHCLAQKAQHCSSCQWLTVTFSS